METKRIDWIDTAKGIGIICVMIAHIDFGIIEKWINSFHMPLFFFLSGYLFSGKRSTSTFLKRKLRTELLPYFALGFPMLLFDFAFMKYTKGYGPYYLKVQTLNFFVQRRYSTFWFLACLLCLNILFYATYKLLKKDKYLVICAVLFPILGFAFYLLGGKSLPWNMDVCFTAYPFYCMGYLYKKNQDSFHEKVSRFTKTRGRAFLTAIILTLFNWTLTLLSFITMGGGFNFYWNQYGMPLFTYSAAFIGIAVVIIVAKNISFFPLKYVGEHSLLYFAWHQAIMIPLFDFFLDKYHITFPVFALKVAIEILVILLVLTIVNLIMEKTPLKIMLVK